MQSPARRRPRLTRLGTIILATLAVVAGTLVAAAPAQAADYGSFSGELKAGTTWTAKPGFTINLVRSYSDEECDNPVSSNDQAPSPTYNVPPDLTGRYVKVYTYPTGAGSASASPCFGPVAAADLHYTGTLKVGETLTRTAGFVFMTGQAFTTSTCSGVAPTTVLTSGGDTKLEMLPSLAGQYLRVRWKNTTTGETGSDPCAGPIAKGTITLGGSVSITGASASGLQVGDVLSVSDQLTGIPAGATKSFRWGFPNLLNACITSGDPSRTFSVPETLLTRKVCVYAAVTAPGYTDAGTSASTTETVKAADKHYTGTLKVGARLDKIDGVNAGSFTMYNAAGCEQPFGSFSDEYDPATRTTFYTVPAAAGGKYVKFSWSSNVGTGSDACEGPVAPGTFDAFTAASYTGTVQVGETLTATDPTVPSGTDLAYSWKVGESEVATTKAYTPAASDGGQQLTLTITASATGYTTKSKSTSGATVEKLSFDGDELDKITIKDSTSDSDPLVGDTLSIDTSAATLPEGTTLSTQWGIEGQEGCELFEADPADELVLTEEHLGEVPCAEVAVSAEGYEDDDVTLYADTVRAEFGSASASFDADPRIGEAVGVESDSSPASDEVSVEWFVADVSVSTEDTYTPAVADGGKLLSAKVTFSKDGYEDTTVTIEGVKVAKGQFPADVRPGITGTAKVGETLTRVGVDSDDLPAGTSLSYVWGVQLPDEDSCDSIGVTSASFTVPPSAKGARICVIATLSATGYDAKVVRSDLTDEVAAHDGVAWLPTISDTTPVFGQVLTASIAPQDLPAGAEVSYTWGTKTSDEDGAVRCSVPEVRTRSAASATHTVALAEIGEQLCVVALVSAPGYDDAESFSRFTAVVEKAPIGAVTVGLDTTAPAVGDVVRASTSGETIPAGASRTYAFGTLDHDECDTSEGSATATHTVTADELGEQLCVTVTVAKAGFASASADSEPTAAVKKGSFTGGSVAFTADPAFGSTASVLVTDPSPTADASTTWTVEGSEPVTAETFTPEAADAGKTLTASVTFSKDGFTDKTVSVSKTITKKSFSGGSVKLSTLQAAVGQKSTATVTEPTPAPDTTEVVWTAGGVEVGTGANYVPTPDDLGKTLVATVTFAKAGHASSTVSVSKTVVKGTITGGSLALAATPTVEVASVATLTAPAEDVDVATRWTIGATQVATGESYTPVAGDVDQKLTVSATLTADGYEDKTLTASKTVVKATFATGLARPAISDVTPSLGQSVSATVASSPEGATVTYAWSVVPVGAATCGTAVKTAATYTPTVADLGQALCVTAKASRPGYVSVSSSSSVTSRISEPASVSLSSSTIRKGQPLTITIKGLTPGRNYVVNIYDRRFVRKAPANGRDQLTFTYPKDATTKKRSVTVTQTAADGSTSFSRRVHLSYSNR